MPSHASIDVPALKEIAPAARSRFGDFKKRKLSLDMTRGKPCAEQLDLSNGMLAVLGPDDYRSADGTDCRNYGGLDGLPEAKALFADFMDVAPHEVVLGDNSSLALMHDVMTRALSHGVGSGAKPWAASPTRFLCPSPGYDRHFALCEHLGIDMVGTDMRDDGPDVEQVAELAASDPTIKGIWVVPKYQNPTGATCSLEVVEKLATMPTAAPDFRIFWDNAYAHHHLTSSPPELANILTACRAAGHADRVLQFGSTSKITFAGAGIAVFAASEANVAWYKTHREKQTIGPDKLNQLRHVRFFHDMDGVRRHMAQHAAILRPKFETVDRIFTQNLTAGLATWTRPLGGYFVSLDVVEGTAKRVVELAKSVGVKLTAAGATYPYGKDPKDQNIRIAPTLPSLPEIETAMQVVTTCVQCAALEQLGL